MIEIGSPVAIKNTNATGEVIGKSLSGYIVRVHGFSIIDKTLAPKTICQEDELEVLELSMEKEEK
jgi:hypothetical protein